MDSIVPVVVQCPHHGQHIWRFEPHDYKRHEGVMRRAATAQLQSLCPVAGNCLTFEPISGETDSPLNWTMRRSALWADDGETVVAIASC